MWRKESRCNKKTVSLLTYWTRLYLLVLLLCLVLMAGISGFWIRMNAYNHHYDLLEMRAQQMAYFYERATGDADIRERVLIERPGRPGPQRILLPIMVQVVDRSGNDYTVKYGKSPAPVVTVRQEVPQSYPEVLDGKMVREKFRLDSQTWLRVGIPVYRNTAVETALYVSSPAVSLLEQVRRLYVSLAAITGVIGLAGWMVLYFLSRKLTRPLLQVAGAARSIARGEYGVTLPERLRERELQQLVESFENMASQLQVLEKLRTDLLAGVSHELRTPVTSIRGMIQAVRDKVVTGPQAGEFLRISLDEAKRLQNMVEELLDISTLESGAQLIEPREADLSSLVDETVRQVTVLPGFERISIIKNIPECPVRAVVDPDRFRQIMLNLLNNSRRASAGKITVSLEAVRDMWRIDVKDDGSGISPHDAPYIFERFYRGGYGKAKTRGLGLGLTISRLLARAHGGDLVLLETSAGGSVFRMTIPRISPGDKGPDDSG